MTEKEEFSSLVRVKDFVEKRAAQIADLLKVVDNARLVSGEVTKGPRTAAQRLPRHMRRRAMAYEIRRFPKGLRKFASSFLISNHRKKPPCRFFRRRTRNLLLNYIRRQKKAVWLETHIWHAKRFHMVERWGYRLPDRCYQRNFRPIYRNSMRHCTVRDKSYLNCFLITGPSQEVLLEKLKAFCAVTVSPTFAFKSALGGLYEMSTLLYRPGFYPQGLLGPARFQWSRNGSKISLAIWIHPTSRDDLLPLLISALSLKKEPKHGENEKEELTEIPKTYEDWKLRSCQILTDVYSSTDGQVTMEDLKDQLVRFRFYGPKSLDVVRAAVQLSSQSTYEESHTVWRKLARIDEVPDSRVFSLLVEDPRVSKPRAPKVPAGKEEEEMGQVSCPVADFWSREKRIEALKNRLTDQEMNRLKGRPVGGATETPAKIPILVIIRHQGTGKQESLDGVEVIAPTGFGRDLWVSAQMQTAHASGLRDDGAAHHEAGCLAFPADYLDTDAGSRESTRVREELELKHEKRPHNRRVRHWKKLSVKFPYSFEFPQLVSNWTGGEETKQTYVLRDRRVLLAIDDWIKDKGKKPEAILSEHKTAMIAVQLCCLARGRPKRFALISLPKTEDLVKIRECQYQGKPFLLREVDKNAVEESSEVSNGIENLEMEKKEDKREWKDIVSLDPSTREKQISLKPLFSSCKNVDKAAKRKILNRKKKEAKKRRVEVQKERLAERNQEEEEKNRVSYRHSASRETVGRVLRGDYSFTAAKGTALAMVPVSSLPKIVEMGRILLLRNITSKYYHPAKVTLLRQAIEL